jgi:hypothetical protein
MKQMIRLAFALATLLIIGCSNDCRLAEFSKQPIERQA